MIIHHTLTRACAVSLLMLSKLFMATLMMIIAGCLQGEQDNKMSPLEKKTVNAVVHGVAVRGGASRGVAAVSDADGRDAVVIWLMDDINRRILQIDAVTGESTSVPVPFDKSDAVYSSLRSRAGKCYSLFGNHFVEYDPAEKQFTFVRNVPSLAAMSMEEDESGRIWAVTYPDCALYSFEPETGDFVEHGILSLESWPQYPRTVVAAPDGWLYIGIGEVAGNIVAYHRETREIRHLLTDDERIRPAMFAVAGTADGSIFGVHEATQTFYKLADGAKTPCEKPAGALLYPTYSGSQSVIISDFPSGSTLTGIDLAGGVLDVLESDGVTKRTVPFSFENYGAPLMSVEVNSDGIAAGGGFFPFFFGTFDPANGGSKDEYANIQCNAILACDKYFYIGGYCGGQILRFDPDRPWNLKDPMEIETPDLAANPVFYGKGDPDINRPHCLAITPDGKFLAMGGTPGYGRTGGGLALVDTVTGGVRILTHKELAENESPFALAALSENLFLVGTTTMAGTGGEVKAENASLLLVDVAEGKTVWRSKALGNVSAVVNLLALPDGNVIGIDSDLRLFRYDAGSRTVTVGASTVEFGILPVTQGPRLLLRDGDEVYLLFKSGVVKVDPEDASVAGFVSVTPEIQVGGAIHDHILYYSSDRQWCSLPLDGLF